MTTPMRGWQEVEGTNSRSEGDGRKRDGGEWSEIHSGLQQMLRGRGELRMIRDGVFRVFGKPDWIGDGDGCEVESFRIGMPSCRGKNVGKRL